MHKTLENFKIFMDILLLLGSYLHSEQGETADMCVSEVFKVFPKPLKTHNVFLKRNSNMRKILCRLDRSVKYENIHVHFDNFHRLTLELINKVSKVVNIGL